MRLRPKDRALAGLILQGLSAKEMAYVLGISAAGVSYRCSSLFRRAGLDRFDQLDLWLIENEIALAGDFALSAGLHQNDCTCAAPNCRLARQFKEEKDESLQ